MKWRSIRYIGEKVTQKQQASELFDRWIMKSGMNLAFALIVVAIALYLGAYFALVERIDVGSNVPLYCLRYRCGSLDLTRHSSIFEPARLLDEQLIRPRYRDCTSALR